MVAELNNCVTLLFGANGQVGYELRQALAGSATLIPLDVPDVDFSRPDTLRAIVRGHRPDIIINAAAYTAVDKAEGEAELAFAINAEAPGVLAEEAEALGACMVHYSTDYVFDGHKTTPYIEKDTPNPLSTYGRTKFEGEQTVRVCQRHLTLRTSWVIGVHGHNFIKTILRLASERDALRVVNDQYGAPTSAALLSKVTAGILSQMVTQPATDARWGLYHLSAKGETSWYGLARYVIARAIAMGLHLKLTPEAITPVGTMDYPLAATRPANSCLDSSKLRSTFVLTLPSWQTGVDDALDRLIPAMKA
jgi:dTDP-4-dehydrorhamnose reductase